MLTLETHSEVPVIPQQLMNYTCNHTTKTDINATLKLLTNPGTAIHNSADVEQYDPIIRSVGKWYFGLLHSLGTCQKMLPEDGGHFTEV